MLLSIVANIPLREHNDIVQQLKAFIDDEQVNIMKKEKALELSLILRAYSEGKTIQRKSVHGWIDIVELSSDDLKQASMTIKGETLDLRIKPQQKLVPFTFDDNHLFRDKWVVIKGYTALNRIEKISVNGIFLGADLFTFSEMLHRCIFDDGSPFGKYVEE